MTVIVTLDPGEMAVAEHLALLRRCVNKAINLTDQRRDNRRQAITLEILGTVAEIAFCKRFSAYPDLTITPRRGGADVVLNGKRWDIKATDRGNGRLITTVGKARESADYYALAVVDDNTVEFVGWASAARLLDDSAIKDLGYGPTYVLERDQLQPFPDPKEGI